MSPQKIMYMQMIENDLQQAWELLEHNAFDLARHHISEASKKVSELQDFESADSTPQNETLKLL
jgi:hypothetical protein